MQKRYSEACERNRGPILEVLREVFAAVERVVEIGAGTGQHAVHFARHLPHLEWVPTDRSDDPQTGGLESVRAWRAEACLDNLAEPRELDVFDEAWPVDEADAVFSANVIHIAPWEATERLFAGAAELVGPGGLVVLYGPFRYADRPLEPSNERFDRWLRQSVAPHSGIRSFEDVCEVAERHGFVFVDDRPMPANNHVLIWRRSGSKPRSNDE